MFQTVKGPNTVDLPGFTGNDIMGQDDMSFYTLFHGLGPK